MWFQGTPGRGARLGTPEASTLEPGRGSSSYVQRAVLLVDEGVRYLPAVAGAEP